VRPKINAPKQNENVVGGQPLAITWETPNGVQAEKVNIEWTTAPAVPPATVDCAALLAQEEALGAMEVELAEANVEDTEDEWQTIAWESPNTGSFTWQVPLHYYPSARLRVTLVSRDNKAGESEVPFAVELPVPTRLKSFDVTIEDGGVGGSWYAGFVVDRPEMKDVRVRQALTLAIDRKRIADEWGEDHLVQALAPGRSDGPPLRRDGHGRILADSISVLTVAGAAVPPAPPRSRPRRPA